MPKLSQLDKFLEGVKIIRKYTNEDYLEAQHDVIYFGAHETIEQMTEVEKELMKSYGWREEYDCWAFMT